jgi:hypothetical protein
MVVSVYFVMIHQRPFLADSFHNLLSFGVVLRAKKSSVRKKEKS